MGTQGYLPPELINRETRDEYQHLPSRDWWGLGCVAFEMFTGHRLLNYDDSSLVIVALTQKEEQDDIEKELKNHPAQPLVKALLERDPEKGVSSAKDIIRIKKIIEIPITPVVSKAEKAVEIITNPAFNSEKIKEIRTLSGHSSSVTSVMFSPDGRMIASGSWDHTIKIWSVSDGCEIGTLRGHSDYIHSVAFSSDGATLASGSDDRTVKPWRIEYK